MDLMALGMFAGGLLLLVGGAEMLVRGASGLSLRLGMAPLVVGLTVVAFGTSAPELAVSLKAALAGQTDIALGNVVGSNIFNILFILGASAAITPLVVNQKLVWFDVPIMIGASMLLYLFAQDSRITGLEGGALFFLLLLYVLFSIRQSRRESALVKEEYQGEIDLAAAKKPLALLVGLVAAGLILLTVGSVAMVDGAVAIATAMGISQLVIGISIVAVGTSLPEVATSLVAAYKGEQDIAVGNVVGSNIFNILGVVGLGGIAAPDGIFVSQGAVNFDLPVVIIVAMVCLTILFSGHMIDRMEGILLLSYYGAFITHLIFSATQHESLETFNWFITQVAIPITVAILLFSAARTLKTKKAPAPTKTDKTP